MNRVNFCSLANVAIVQNRELQIMRIVAHPNVVDLRAFFYSNGDRVSRDCLVL